MAEQDPEINRQNAEATEANTKARQSETEALSKSQQKMLEMIATMMAMSTGGKQSAESFKKLAQASGELTEAEKAYAQQQEISKKAQANYDNAVKSSNDALKNFAGAMTNTSTEFSKFNSTLASAGDAALSLGKSFGPLGLILGGLIKGATKLTEMYTKQADNTLKATDEMSKMGGAGANTTKSVAEMAMKIGLSNEQFGLMTNAMKRANTGMAGLGATAGEGQQAFGKMLAVTNQQREAFQRLGVSQEDLMNQQADYVKLQEMSGKSLASQAKDGDKLRQESLAYAENLSRLSALTGKSADKLQKEQEAAMLEYEEIVATRIEDDKIRKLKAEGRKDEAEGIEKEQKARKAYINQVTNQLGKEAGLQVGKVARTGAFDSSTAGLASLGITAQDVQKGFKGKTEKEAQQGAADFTQQIKEKQSEKLGQLGTALQYGGESLGKQFFLGKESLQETGKFVERNEGQANKEAGARTAGAAEGSATAGGVAATDTSQLLRNEQTTATIELNNTLEKMLMESNPLISGFNKLTLAITGLTAAAVGIAGYLAAKSAMKGAGDALGKIIGKGASKATTVAEGAAGAASKAGGAMKYLGTAGKVLGKVAAPLAIASAGYHAIKGYNNAEDTLGIKGRKATTGEKMSSAAGGALSGLTFGLISSETISKGIAKATGAGPDKESEKKQAEEAQLKSDNDNTEATKKLDASSTSLIKALDALRASVDALSGKITGGAAPSGGAGGGAAPSGGGAPPTAGGAAAPKDQNVKSNLSSIAEALKKKGIDDPNYIKAVLGNVMKETGGKNISENLDYSKTSNKRIREIFGSRAEGKSDEELDKIKSSQESMGEFMYGGQTKIGKSMGNTEAGDGWKYRGRGFIQLTGKNNYAAASQAIFGDDTLVKNPDAVMDPKVSSQVVAWYMEKSKGKMQASMGLGSGPMSEADANLLATSQVAGRDVRKSSDYLKNELLGKVTDNAKNMGEFVNTPAVATANSSNTTPPKTPPVATASTSTETPPKTPPVATASTSTETPPKTPQASEGGIFSGPESGYPVTLHGKEAVIPDFKIPDLIASLKEVSQKDLPAAAPAPMVTSNDNGDMMAILSDMVQMLSDKLDTVIDVLEDGNDTSGKILQYSQV